MPGNPNISLLRILIVDDEEFILNLAVRLLKSLGCENIDTANDGKHAIQKLSAEGEPFDIVICDLKMPDMDGYDFMLQVAEWGCNGGLIIHSGEGKKALKKAEKLAKSKKLNILGVIPKPLDPALLEKLLKKFISI